MSVTFVTTKPIHVEEDTFRNSLVHQCAGAGPDIADEHGDHF